MTVQETDNDTALSSLIFTLAEGDELKGQALQALGAFPGLTLGELQGRWVPGVLEADIPQNAFRELEALPGIELVEVVYVQVQPPADAPEAHPPAAPAAAADSSESPTPAAAAAAVLPR
jgi:hypothetical protein